ncbi:hypothetical protein Bca52824_018909 [Brassica carinata]|uniref:Uncharacterized protein n=1 Tax=Brassica carinata TaxID=52824 RepID=A0A8X8AZ09_BRACI|nr:hypothetical protein Bca52824_018909 [Brassica carinata]
MATCLKYCSQAEKGAVFKELHPHFLNLASNTYAVHVLKKMLDGSSADIWLLSSVTWSDLLLWSMHTIWELHHKNKISLENCTLQSFSYSRTFDMKTRNNSCNHLTYYYTVFVGWEVQMVFFAIAFVATERENPKKLRRNHDSERLVSVTVKQITNSSHSRGEKIWYRNQRNQTHKPTISFQFSPSSYYYYSILSCVVMFGLVTGVTCWDHSIASSSRFLVLTLQNRNLKSQFHYAQEDKYVKSEKFTRYLRQSSNCQKTLSAKILSAFLETPYLHVHEMAKEELQVLVNECAKI